MQCPSCASDNVQRLKLIYESGTQKIRTTSRTHGSSYSHRGGFGIGRATTQTSGQSQTIEAQRVAPPSKQPYKIAVITAMAGLVLIWYATSHSGGGATLLGLVAVGIAVWLGYKAYRYNTTQWPGKYEIWSRSWQCNKCGDVYAS